MPSELVPVHTTADTYNRIAIPKEMSDCVSWLNSAERFRVWLLLLEAGRYRLLSDEQVQNDPQLEPVRSLIVEGKSAEVTDPTFAEELKRDVMVARLVQTTIAPFNLGWRISFPKAFTVFLPPDCDPKAFSILFTLEGYLEFWYTDVLRKASFLPLGSRQSISR